IPSHAKIIDSETKQHRSELTPQLGLTVLDEPSTKQANQAVLDLQLRSLHKSSTIPSSQHVRTISLSFSSSIHAASGQKALTLWVQSVNDLHLHKPPDRVEFTNHMPEVENLMAEWPPEVNSMAISNEVVRKIFLKQHF
ncbi:Intraflagellar transport protein 46, partial [Nowakowskiella sp. JEL0078]